MSDTVQVWIGTSSPLLAYTPSRNGVTGSSWVQEGGFSKCQGSITYAVELDSIYFTNATFYWSATNSFTIQIGLDGELQNGSSSSGRATLSSTSFASHSARLECTSSSSSSSMGAEFEFAGVMLETEVVPSGTGINATLDDSSSQITYSGFQSTSRSKSSISAIQNGSFYQDTVSYSSSQGATASFSFQGTALYIFGMTGPEFGIFQITLDSTVIGTYNASTTVETYNTLLFFRTALSSGEQHEIVVENMEEGMLVALDYFVAVQSANSGTSGSTVVGTTTTSTSTYNAGATAVFTNSSASGGSGSGDSSGTIAGAVIGTLAGIALLWIWWRYHVWKRDGGQGSFVVALCGPRRKIDAAKAKEKKFHIWPMIHSQPKYATR